MARQRKQPDQKKNWPEWKGEWMDLAEMQPHPDNERTHPDAQIELLSAALIEFGPDQPIVVDENNVIIKGAGRRSAAGRAGMTRFPVVRRTGLTDAQKTALRIQDNQTALLSGWDSRRMQTSIARLRESGYKISMLGFSDVQLRKWDSGLPAPDQRNPDDIPATPKKPVVRVGDLWTLGKHRLLCGDSTKAESWQRLFEREKAAMVFTDPPYGVSYQAPSGEFGVIEGDKKRRDELYKMLVGSLREMTRHAQDTAAFYIWHASSTREDFAQAMKAVGLAERQYLMWVKPAIVFGHADYQWQHEPCLYANKDGHSPKFYGERAESTVWHISLMAANETAATIGNGLLLLNGEGGQLYVQSRVPKGKKFRQIRITKESSALLSGGDRHDTTVWEVARDGGHEHPTQKPVELARRAIENSSQAGEIVADGFLGSGTTLIGAEMTARRCYGTELDPVYAEVIIRRWERLTGQRATLGDKTLDEVTRERRRGRAT